MSFPDGARWSGRRLTCPAGRSMNGILVLPTRFVCGLLLACLAFAAHSDRAELHGFRTFAVGFQQAGLHHGKNSPLALTSAAIVDEDDPDRSQNDCPDVPLAARPFVLLPGPVHSPIERGHMLALIRHGPCAAPQTGPPDLHAA